MHSAMFNVNTIVFFINSCLNYVLYGIHILYFLIHFNFTKNDELN